MPQRIWRTAAADRGPNRNPEFPAKGLMCYNGGMNNSAGLSSLSKLRLAAALVLFGSAARAASLDYAIVNDHADLLYACGERASFTVTVKEKGGAVPTAGVVSARLDNFGPHEVASATWDLAVTNVFTLSGALAEPGFLRLTLRAKDTADKVWSVGYAPEKIRKGSPSPA